MIKNCVNCNNEFETKIAKSQYCSKECRTEHRKAERAKSGFEKNNKKYDGLEEGLDYVVCKECGLKGQKLQFHIQMVHNTTVAEYRLKHNVDQVTSQKLLLQQSERVKGDKNPAYQHGGRLSPFSDKFVGKTTKEEAVAKLLKTKSENPQNENTKLEYYTSRGYTEEEAIQLRSDRQSTFSLEKCIEKYGEEEGYKKWLARQEKWQTTLKSKSDEEIAEINKKKLPKIGPISKAEQSIANYLRSVGISIDQQHPIKRENQTWYHYDIVSGNKIIEYNGDYWHANPMIYEETHSFKRNKLVMTAKDIWNKDQNKIQTAIRNGYEVFVVWESEYLKDEKGTIEKCINFLKQ